MKKLLCLLPIMLLLCSCQAEPINKTGFFLDTIISIDIFDKERDEAAAIIEESFRMCREYENLLSKTVSTSEIAQINKHHSSENISSDTALLISRAIYYSNISDGAFDITVEPVMSLWQFSSPNPTKPSVNDVDEAMRRVGYRNIILNGHDVSLQNSASIDLGGIAKGYIADKIKEYIVSEGVDSAIINLGGDISTVGNGKNGSPFKIGLQKPFSENGEILGVIQVTGQSVMTSGVYERYFIEDETIYHHIVDPKTGYPTDNGLYSVTIISERSIDGDALSTACITLGLTDGLALLESLDKIEGIFVTDDNQIFKTSGIGTKIPFDEIQMQ